MPVLRFTAEEQNPACKYIASWQSKQHHASTESPKTVSHIKKLIRCYRKKHLAFSLQRDHTSPCAVPRYLKVALLQLTLGTSFPACYMTPALSHCVLVSHHLANNYLSLLTRSCKFLLHNIWLFLSTRATYVLFQYQDWTTAPHSRQV